MTLTVRTVGNMGKLSRVKWCLLGCLTVVLILLVISVFVPGSLTGAVRWVASQHSARELRGSLEQEYHQEATWVEVVVENIVLSENDLQPVSADAERNPPSLIALDPRRRHGLHRDPARWD